MNLITKVFLVIICISLLIVIEALFVKGKGAIFKHLGLSPESVLGNISIAIILIMLLVLFLGDRYFTTFGIQ